MDLLGIFGGFSTSISAIFNNSWRFVGRKSWFHIFKNKPYSANIKQAEISNNFTTKVGRKNTIITGTGTVYIFLMPRH